MSKVFAVIVSTIACESVNFHFQTNDSIWLVTVYIVIPLQLHTTFH